MIRNDGNSFEQLFIIIIFLSFAFFLRHFCFGSFSPTLCVFDLILRHYLFICCTSIYFVLLAHHQLSFIWWCFSAFTFLALRSSFHTETQTMQSVRTAACDFIMRRVNKIGFFYFCNVPNDIFVMLSPGVLIFFCFQTWFLPPFFYVSLALSYSFVFRLHWRNTKLKKVMAFICPSGESFIVLHLRNLWID